MKWMEQDQCKFVMMVVVCLIRGSWLILRKYDMDFTAAFASVIYSGRRSNFYRRLADWN